jgi:acetyl esterase/lipase
MKFFALLATLATAALAGCASHKNAPEQSAPVPDTEFRVESSIVYTPADWPEPLHADLYIPRRNGSAPGVLLVHGGGWERRSRDDMTWIAEELAGRGFVVMNIDYRFAPEYTFPSQLYDLQIAMNWLHSRAGSYGLDPDAIAAFGFSSGAHLVSLMALVADTGHTLNQPHGGAKARPVAVVAGGLPADLRAFGSGKLIRQFLGGEQSNMPGVYATASPITHVTASAPPFFLFHGGMDMLVPVSQAESFRAKLNEHQVENEFYLMHLRGHVTSFLTAGTVMDEAADFLVRHTRNQRAFKD